MSMFEDYFDPCPLDDNWTIDGLTLNWAKHGRVYVNPPYSNPMPWVRKAIAEFSKSECCIVLLLKHDSSTKWYSLLQEAGARFFMLQGRLTFDAPEKIGPAPFPSILAILSSRDCESQPRLEDYA
jgi:phage N-6-adenine-methyltransferase